MYTIKEYSIKVFKFVFRHTIYTPKRPLRNILNWLGLLYIIIILFPYPFFDEEYSNNNIKVYSTNEIDEQNLVKILSTVDSLLSKSRIYDPSKKHKLFMCNNKSLYMIFSLIGFKKSFGVYNPLTHYVFFPEVDFNNNTVINYNPNSKRAGDLARVITHEIMHYHFASYIGKLRNLFYKWWKKEGYCDYTAKNSSFDLDEAFQLIRDGRETSKLSSFRYFKYRLYVTYLLDIEGITLDHFINTKFDTNILDKEILTHLIELEKIIRE